MWHKLRQPYWLHGQWLTLAKELAVFFAFAVFLIRRVYLTQLIYCTWNIPIVAVSLNKCKFAFLSRNTALGLVKWKCLTVHKTKENCTKGYAEEWTRAFSCCSWCLSFLTQLESSWAAGGCEPAWGVSLRFQVGLLSWLEKEQGPLWR